MTDFLAIDDFSLAPYAMRGKDSRGRRFHEEAHPFRSVYQRDRERIVHCSAFRRMLGKTQVMVGQLNDHHRTRLTHSLEVAQISRTIARRLRLNEDLTEAIALSHDVGHPPFGHAGEQALAACLQHHGGFDHNLNGLRRVEYLEERYPDFPGLNLSWELREAFVQHSKRRDLPHLAEFCQVGSPLLEAQLADACDSLAYDTHDTDDALGLNLIRLEDLEEVPLWRQTADSVRAKHGHLRGDQFRTAVLRELIARQVLDMITETERRLTEHRIQSVTDVRACPSILVGFSPELLELKLGLQLFLRQRVYRHHRVIRMAEKGKVFLTRLFEEFVAKPELLPARHLSRWRHAPAPHRQQYRPGCMSEEESLECVVADYLAGMTDRFAQQEYARLFHPEFDS